MWPNIILTISLAFCIPLPTIHLLLQSERQKLFGAGIVSMFEKPVSHGRPYCNVNCEYIIIVLLFFVWLFFSQGSCSALQSVNKGSLVSYTL